MDGLYRWDMDTFRAVNLDWRAPWLDPVFWLLSYSGLSQIQILGTFLLYRWPATRRLIVPCLLAIAVSGLAFAQVIKKLAPRDRPSNLRIAVVQEDFHHSSFVSGHTCTAFALATMVLLMTLGSRRAWVGGIALLWALGVGVSRVYRGVHWPSDVLAGACAGVMGAAVMYLFCARRGWLDLTLENVALPKPFRR